MSEVLHGDASGDQLNVRKDKTQVYGLSGNDTLISDKKSDVLLVGGSGDDSLIMLGGKGTLSGGDGADIFELNYSATNPISAVIEDLDPAEDKIVVNFDGKTVLNFGGRRVPQLSSTISSDDVVWTDGGNFNLTVKSVRDNDYFDGDASKEAWEILQLTNDEREKENLTWLTMSEGLTKGAQIRAEEITGLADRGALSSHTRPESVGSTEWFTVLEGKYHSYGENLQAGAESSAEAIEDWMNSEHHKENILDEKSLGFSKLGVGYNYEDLSKNEYYWTQLFADSLVADEMQTVSAEDLLTADISPVNLVRKFISLTRRDNIHDNTEYGATIQALGGNDFITNSGLNVSISGGTGDDTIDNRASFVTIAGGKGNDLISLSNDAKENVIQYTIGDGSDTISGFSETDTLSMPGVEYTPVTVDNNVVVSVGRDSITLEGAASLDNINFEGIRSNLFRLTEGDDTLNNTVESATIQAQGGEDKITNSGANAIIDGGEGEDRINNSLAANVTITGGDDDDKITNSGNFVTIAAGAGNDSINNSGENVLFVHESGDDTIRGFNSTSMLKVLGRNYSSVTSGRNLILINADTKNSITILNSNAINIVDANDKPLEIERTKNIIYTEKADTINNIVDNVTIAGLGGDDTITNKGDNVSIGGGNDKDTITNTGSEVTITGGEGADYISSSGDNNSIFGGADNDTVEISGDENTINAEGGDDFISVKGARNVIDYVAGDGTDVIEGFDKTSILRISGDVYTSTTSGNDVVVTVGEGLVSLVGAAELDKVNIIGSSQSGTVSSDILNYNGHSYRLIDEGMTWEEAKAYCESLGGHLVVITDADEQAAVEGLLKEKGTKNSYWMGGFKGEAIGVTIENTVSNTLVTGTAYDDSISNTGNSVTIQAQAGSDSITNYGDNVSIDSGAGNDTIYGTLNGGNWGSSWGLTVNGGEGDDYVINDGDNSSISGDTGNDYISNSGVRSIIEGDSGNDTVFNYGSKVSILGGAGDDTIFNGGYYDDILHFGGSSISISGGEDNDYISNYSEGTSISGGDGDDTITSRVHSGTLSSDGLWNTINAGAGDDSIYLYGGNNQIFYNAGDGSDTIEGLTSNDTINIFGTTYTRSTIGNDVILSVDDDSITLKDAATLSTINIDGEEDTTSAGTPGETINNSTSNTLIMGTSGDDSIFNDENGDSVTIDGGAGDDTIRNGTLSGGSNVSINGGAGDDSIYNYGASAIIVGDAGNDSIYSDLRATIYGGAGHLYFANLASFCLRILNMVSYSSALALLNQSIALGHL